MTVTDSNRDDPQLAAARDAAHADPQNGAAWKALAMGLIQHGRFGEALQSFEKAAARLPDDAECGKWLGTLGELHRARQLARDLLKSRKLDAARQVIAALRASGWVDGEIQALARAAKMKDAPRAAPVRDAVPHAALNSPRDLPAPVAASEPVPASQPAAASRSTTNQPAASQSAPTGEPATAGGPVGPAGLANACVYTCLFGDYEQLNEFPVALDSRLARFCFTDNPELKSDSWTIRLVKPAFPMDSVRSQRRVKILAHEYLPPNFEASLYIDNTVALLAKPEALFQQYLGEADMAVPYHSFRASVFDEFVTVAKSGLDEATRIYEQLNHYQMLELEALAERPYWTAILLRHHQRPGVRDAMVSWYNHVMRYSRRDQLSFNIALLDASVAVQPIVVDNLRSWFHQWPRVARRDSAKRLSNASMSGASLRAQIRSTEMDLQFARQQMAERDRKIAGLTAALAERDRLIQQAGQPSFAGGVKLGT